MVLKAWHLLALATGLAFGLALHQLTHDSFWLDEITTWRFASLPFAKIWAIVAWNFHPPYYFQFVHGWLKVVGVALPDEFWLRLPSVFFFALTVPAVYRVGQVLGGTSRAGVYAALLVATSPFLLRYGQEARAYAMLTFFAACGFAAIAQIVCGYPKEARPRLIGAGLARASGLLARGHFRASGGALGDDGAWVVYIVSSVAVMGLHYTAAGLYPLVTGLILFCALRTAPSFRGVRFANFSIAMAILALVYSSQIPHLLSGMERMYSLSGTPGLFSIFDLFQRAYGNGHFPGWSWIPFVILASLAVGTLVAWARRGRWERVVFAGIGWLAAPMLLIAFSFWEPILLPKLVIWTLVPFLALCGAGFSLLPSSPVRVVLLAGLLSSNLQGVAAEWTHVREDWKGVVRIIARDASPDVAVVVVLPLHFFTFDYYWSREKREISPYVSRVKGDQWVRMLPDESIDRTEDGWARFPLPWERPESVKVDPAGLFPAYRRVWVVWGPSREGRTGFLMEALEEKGKLVERQILSGLHLLRYERRE